LLGHRRLNSEDRKTQTQSRYSHWNDRRHREMCDDIRKAIDKGDKALVQELKDKGIKWKPDISLSLDIYGYAMKDFATNRATEKDAKTFIVFMKWVQELIKAMGKEQFDDEVGEEITRQYNELEGRDKAEMAYYMVEFKSLGEKMTQQKGHLITN